ncbi:EAL domain-containing protein [Kordiimonas gwangyangensis]|uniref:EAL domain-containing protein n=1 Tax=Kordiimonas gwangyangensis TaxID=288022 RepID=UPI000375A585|nr:EAL domain-containing protein [Kordiimonas gwangyangensis]
MRCLDCETVKNHLFDETYFWIYLPTGEGHAKASRMIQDRAYDHTPVGSLGIRIKLPRADVSDFLTTLFGSLNGLELANTNVVTTACDKLEPEDLGRVITADVFINRFHSQWIIEAMAAEQFESWMQPIVHAGDPDISKPFAHEALFRMRDNDGNIIPPGHVFAIAGKSDLLFSLDLAARRKAVETAAAAKLKGKLFINFNPSSVYDPAYCLRTTASAIADAGLRPEDVVFELTETHMARDKAHLKGILAFYRNSGFGVALDDIGSGWSGLNMLHEMRPDYVKLDMELVRNVDSDAFKQVIVRNLISIAHSSGILTIAEGIETAQEADFLRDAGADYLQGYHFARPAPVTAAI